MSMSAQSASRFLQRGEGDGYRAQLRDALGDLLDGLRWWPLWTTLAWMEIRQRYRRSMLGPLWLTVTMGIMVSVIGYLYSGLFRMDAAYFVPYVAAGVIFWTLLVSFFNEGGQVFSANEQRIRNLVMPYSTHVYRLLARSLIVLGHNALVFVAVSLVFDIEPTRHLWLLPAGLALVLINGIWLVLALGMITLRFRDLGQLINSVMAMAAFVTPVFWHPSILDAERLAIAQLNPLYHLLELVRAPLLGEAPSAQAWTIGGLMALFGSLVTLMIFARFRRRMVLWL